MRHLKHSNLTSQRRMSFRTSKSRTDASGCFRKASTLSPVICPRTRKSLFWRRRGLQNPTCSKLESEEPPGNRSQAGTSSPRMTARFIPIWSALWPSACAQPPSSSTAAMCRCFPNRNAFSTSSVPPQTPFAGNPQQQVGDLLVRVRRSVVMMVEGIPKTEASAKDLPLDAALAESLLKLKLRSPYQQPTDWVFASPEMKGKQPLWPDTMWRRYGKPAVKAAEITKRVAFHTFRHTYTTLLTQNNEDVKVVQELLRHANSRITLDLYAQAGMAGKREAQRKVVELVLKKGKAVA